MIELRHKLWSLAAVLLTLAACGGEATSAAVEAGAAERSAQAPGPSAPEPPEAIARLLSPYRGSFDEMVERRLIRVLVVYNRTHYFLDGATQRGITADALVEFEKFLNRELRLRNPPLHVAAIPVARDELIPFLEQGRGDMAAANLTATPERRERVDFSASAYPGVAEVVVAGPASPALESLDDLAGKAVHVRRSSSFYDSLQALNESFRGRGLAEIEIVTASEFLETEDLLEMVEAGLIPLTVADDYLARFWAQMLPDLRVREDLAVASGGEIAWAIRRDAEGLKPWADRFVTANRKGTLLGNMLIKRYFQSARYIDNALDREDRRRFDSMVELFRTYAERYDFDYLMVAAQGYQESRLDQSVRSHAGAVGVMQLLPSTAADPAVGIPDVEDLESNIHAGTKYLRHLKDVYFNDPEIDTLQRTLFAFAAYNAGPNRIRRLRSKAAELGYDPNRWFGNVELVVAREVGQEPVQYVRNIFKYYTAYRLVADQAEARRQAREQAGGAG